MSKKQGERPQKPARIISRRDFLKSAGIVAGTVGSVALLNACSPATTTITNTVTNVTVTF